MLKSNSLSYTTTAKCLHWLMAVLILLMVGYGWTLDDLQETVLSESLSYHALGGILVIFLLILRFLWRITHSPPTLPDSVSSTQKKAAKVVHILFYLLMFIIPITGLITVVSHEEPVVLLNRFDLQELFSFIGQSGFEAKRAIHANAIYFLLTLIIGHIGMAFLHQFWFKNNVLSRILLSRSK